MTPPRLAERLIRRALSRWPRRAEVLGDLEEEFRERANRGGLSKRVAPLLYLTSGLVTAWHLHRTRSHLHLHELPRSESAMNSWLRDARYAAASIGRAPALVAVVVATFGLGIGASVAIFSVVNGVLLKPLDFHDSDRLIGIWGAAQDRTKRPLPAGDFEDIRLHADLLEVAGRWSNSGSLTGDHEPREVAMGWVDPEYFGMLRVQPLHGRLLTDADVSGVVLGNGIWRDAYGSDPGVVGTTIHVNGTALEVIGVLPPDPNPNLPGTSGVPERSEMWRLLDASWYVGSEDRQLGWIRVAARVRDGATVEQAEQQLSQLATAARPPENAGDQLELWYEVEPVLEGLVGDVRPTLLALSGAVGFLVLIAALNVAQLLLTRGRGKAGEVAVRNALGAGRGDLLRQFVFESLILATLGGVAGTAIAFAGIRALVAAAPANLPRLDSVTFDPSVAAFGAVVTLLAALVAGVVPAVISTRNPGATLRTRAGTPGRRFQRWSSALVIGEVALALVLLAGAGLLARSFLGLLQEQPGFIPDRLLTLSVTAAGSFDPEETNPFTPIRHHLEQAPGVVAVGGTNRIPLGGGLFTGYYATEAMGPDAEDKPFTDYRWITPGYLEAMGTRVVEGRGFAVDEPADKILVDRNLAEAAWPGQSAVGQKLWTGTLGRDGELSEVIGVVEPMKHTGVADNAALTLYFNAINAQANSIYLAVRTTQSAEAAVDTVVAEIRRVDPGATISRIRTMESLVSDSNAPWRFAFSLMTVFAVVAVTITMVGLYSVVAYTVAQRTQEFGIRKALGAPRSSVASLVLGRTMVLVATGTALGAVGAAALSGLVSELLFRVEPTDPSTYAGVIGFMLLAGLLGAWRPTSRALRVSPRIAMTDE